MKKYYEKNSINEQKCSSKSDNIAFTEIIIYPNPTKGMVYFTTKGNVKIYNQQGKLLQKTFGKEIDLSAYADGIYLLEIERTNARIIKQ